MTNENNPQFSPYIRNADQDDEIDLKRLFYLLLRRWYWLALCLILGTSAAYLYVQYAPKKYKVDTSLLISENKQGLDLQNMFMEKVIGTTSQPLQENESALLRSYKLNHQAIDNLNWQALWQKKNLVVWNGIYMNEPFILQKSDDAPNPSGIFLNITPLTPTQYRIEAAGEANIGEQPVNIEFSAVANFGEPFKNQYFSFTLHLNGTEPDILGNEYRFAFIDKSRLTNQYLKRLELNFVKESYVITLSLESTEPLRDIHYLNELVRVYLDMKLEQQTQSQKRSLEFIDKQISGISTDLSQAENTFTEFRSKNQIIDISSQGNIIMEQLKEIEMEKSQQQMQLDYFKNLRTYLGNIQSADQLIAPSVVGITDATLNSLVMKLSELYSRRKVLSFSARENNPTLIMLNEEIEQVTEQLREMLVNLIDNTELVVRTLNQRYNRINQQLNNMPEQEQKLINIQRQYELTNEIFTFLLQRRAELEISLAASVVDIQIIDPAQYERLQNVSGNPMLILIIGAFLGLLIPALIIILADFFNNKIHLQEDVEKLTALPILGNVLHSRMKTDLVVFANPTAPITESYRTIRTNLQYKLLGNGGRVISLHSLMPGEGKTFNATNLATILAMNERKTILVGADMRKPRLQKIYDISNQKGLSTYLAGHAEMGEIIVPTKIENLSLIPSGPVPPNPAELLERPAFKALIDQLKKDYDYIIIDNAPVSVVTDGLITGKQSDLNLFVLRYGISKKDQLKYINEVAAKGILNNPGIIINDIKISRFGYGYGYSYHYNYAYRKGYGE